MTIFDHQRLASAKMKLDIEGLRSGYYSDKYFENVVRILEGLSSVGYTFAGHNPREIPYDVSKLQIGDLIVEVQVFNRRAPKALVAGIDIALAMLRHASGYFQGEKFVETYSELDITAVEDGVFTYYDGDPENVQTVLEIRGRYRDFALLETTILGVLTRASRIATNVYSVLEVSSGKPVLFFPARFDLPEVQMIDGYAYWLAVQRYNMDTEHQMSPLVSTDAQAAWWSGRGGGTIPHALIACFLTDTAESMLAFAHYRPVDIPRIVLADFNNDTIADSLATLNAFWPHYRTALEAENVEEQRRWTLYGVRLDTSSNVRDVAVGAGGPTGVNPMLVRKVREALDNAWRAWNVPTELQEAAKSYCKNVKIVVSGGFNRDKVEQFEHENVPVDIYGVGSTFLQNDKASNTDFTMDVVRVQINGHWVDMAKVGRQPCDNKDLHPVDLGSLV
jgi:nicotinate phosphoribosyltransferase